MQIQKLINPPLEMSAPLYGSVLCLGNRNDARRFPKGQRPAPTNRAVVKRRFGRELRAMQCCLFRGPGSTSAGPSRVRHTCGAYMGHSRSWPKWLREREKKTEREVSLAAGSEHSWPNWGNRFRACCDPLFRFACPPQAFYFGSELFFPITVPQRSVAALWCDLRDSYVKGLC